MNPNGFIYTAPLSIFTTKWVKLVHCMFSMFCDALNYVSHVLSVPFDWEDPGRLGGPLDHPGRGGGGGELWGHKNGHGFPTILPHVCCHSLFKAVYMCMSNLINMYVTSFLAAAKSGWGPRGTELHLLLSTACIKGCGFLRCRKADPRSSLDLSLCVLNI